MRKALQVLAIGLIVSPQALAGGFGSGVGAFADGFMQGQQRAQELRLHQLERQRLEFCNKTMKDYLDGKGPPPPAMCTGARRATATQCPYQRGCTRSL